MVYYGETFYKSKTLSEWANAYIKFLPLDVSHLISKGSSGCTIASAMLVLAKQPLRHLFLRKGEKAHSSSYAGYKPDRFSISAIVDDFTSSGETISSILNWDAENYRSIKYVIISRCTSSALNNILQRHFEKTDINVKIIMPELDKEEYDYKKTYKSANTTYSGRTIKTTAFPYSWEPEIGRFQMYSK